MDCIYIALLSKALYKYCLTFIHSCTHSHTASGVSHATWQPACPEQSGGEVPCSGTPRHPARGSRRGNRTHNLAVTNQLLLYLRSYCRPKQTMCGGGTSIGWRGPSPCGAPPACPGWSCRTGGWGSPSGRPTPPRCPAGSAPRTRSRSGGRWWWRGPTTCPVWCWTGPGGRGGGGGGGGKKGRQETKGSTVRDAIAFYQLLAIACVWLLLISVLYKMWLFLRYLLCCC